jgi:hypothetical protein
MQSPLACGAIGIYAAPSFYMIFNMRASAVFPQNSPRPALKAVRARVLYNNLQKRGQNATKRAGDPPVFPV